MLNWLVEWGMHSAGAACLSRIQVLGFSLGGSAASIQSERLGNPFPYHRSILSLIQQEASRSAGFSPFVVPQAYCACFSSTMLSQALKASSASSSSNLLASSGSISAASLFDCHSAQHSPAGALALHVSADDYALDSPKHVGAEEQEQIDEEEPFWVTASNGSGAEQPSPFAQEDTSGLDALCRSFVANGLSHRCAQ